MKKTNDKGYVIKCRSLYDWYAENDSIDIYALSIYDYLLTYTRQKATVYKGIKLRPGQIIRSYGQIAKALKIGRQTVIRKMSVLSNAGAIEMENTRLETGIANIITVKTVFSRKLVKNTDGISEEDLKRADEILKEFDQKQKKKKD